ncbi:MAG: hypothetical protein QF554_05360 [Dehalococcoidia bacterium]|jgi:hypothetical protein|nr:hypothetical protein [Dehalococcoidia bacterium]
MRTRSRSRTIDEKSTGQKDRARLGVLGIAVLTAISIGVYSYSRSRAPGG